MEIVRPKPSNYPLTPELLNDIDRFGRLEGWFIRHTTTNNYPLPVGGHRYDVCTVLLSGSWFGMNEHDIRAVVRDELRRIVRLGVSRDPVDPAPPRGAGIVQEFVATLPAGARIGGAELYQRFEAAHPGALTATAFGRAASRAEGLRRERTPGGRVYVVASPV